MTPSQGYTIRLHKSTKVPRYVACRAARQAQAPTPLSKSVRKMSIMPVIIFIWWIVTSESGCYRNNTQTKTRCEELPCLWPGCNVQHPYAVRSLVFIGYAAKYRGNYDLYKSISRLWRQPTTKSFRAVQVAKHTGFRRKIYSVFRRFPLSSVSWVKTTGLVIE